MRPRTITLAVAAVLAAAAVVTGAVAVAGADSTTRLAAITAPELLAKMATSHGQTQAVSGEVSWTNGLFGDVADMAGDTFGGMPAQSPLFAGGSGRVWMSEDGVRLESQGGGGDQVLVVSGEGRDAWVYDYAADTTRHVIVTGADAGFGVTHMTPSPAASPASLTPAGVGVMLQRLAPLGSLSVEGQAAIAGREAYVLAFTPAAADTALGAVKVAIDGQRYVPLRLQVFARGGTEPVLQSGFDSVSFAAIDAERFTFTPPPGANVTTETIDAAELRRRAKAETSGLEDQARKALTEGELDRALLSRSQAEQLVPYELATASADARPFRRAFVLEDGMPLTASGVPLLDLAVMGALASHDGQAAGEKGGPVTVQVYGSGLGSIVLVQSPSEPQPSAAEQPATPQSPGDLEGLTGVVEQMDVNGRQAAVVTTPLGGVVMWRQGGTTLVAAGMVPAADLRDFARSVR